MTTETNDATFANDIQSNLPVLVDFWAPWCGPCRQLSPIIDQIAQEFAGKILVLKCNVDDNPEAPSKYSVRGIPALMLFKNGNLLDSKVGSVPKSALIEWLNKHIA